VNNYSGVNIPRLTGRQLKTALQRRLGELWEEISWLQGVEVNAASAAQGGKDAGFDLESRLPLPGGGKTRLCIEVKGVLRPGDVARLAEQVKSGLPEGASFVLALPWVSERLADLCAQRGWSWYDLAGNCRIDVPGLLHLSHTGNPPVHERPRSKGSLRTAEAARVVRALLHPEHLPMRWTQRDMQKHCQPGVSLGLVNKVVRYLIDEAYLTELEGGGFRLTDPVKLLQAWRDAYRFERHQRLSFFTLLQGRKLQDALASLDVEAGGRAAYASFSAAEFQAPHVRQPKTWLFVAHEMLPRLQSLAEAKPVDSGENLVVLMPEDDGVFYLGESVGEGRMRVTCAVQTYADLWHSGGRGQEAAEALLNQRLIPAWKAAGWPS
jgi:hypothetical protein